MVIFFSSTALYALTLSHGFIFDDKPAIVDNVHIRSLRHIPDIFKGTYWAGSDREHGMYRPLTTLSFAFNFSLTGLSAWSYHLVNLTLHGLISTLVLFVALHWGLSLKMGVIGASLFAVHPIHVEPVTNLAARGDLLATFFLLIMMLLHPFAKEKGGWTTILPALAYALAMFSKEVGVVGIVWIFFQDRLIKHPHPMPSRQAVRIYLCYAIVLIAYMAARFHAVGGFWVPVIPFLDNPLAHTDALTRMLTSLSLFGKGFLLLLCPLNLSADYSYNGISLIKSVSEMRFLGHLILIIGLLTLGFIKHRYTKFIKVAGGCYLLAWLPSSNLLFPIGTIFGERLLYLPSVVFCMMAGVAIVGSLDRFSKWVLPSAAILICLILSVRSVSYALAWKDPISLFSAAVKSVPGSAKAHYNLGAAFRDAGDLKRAKKSWLKAITIYPDHVESLGDLGSLSFINQRWEKAKSYWERAVKVAPNRGAAWYNLGLLYRRLGNQEASSKAFQRFVEVGSIEFPKKAKQVKVMLERGEY
jgi:tetratricopeptide (TPR) repeat protein